MERKLSWFVSDPHPKQANSSTIALLARLCKPWYPNVGNGWRRGARDCVVRVLARVGVGAARPPSRHREIERQRGRPFSPCPVDGHNRWWVCIYLSTQGTRYQMSIILALRRCRCLSDQPSCIRCTSSGVCGILYYGDDMYFCESARAVYALPTCVWFGSLSCVSIIRAIVMCRGHDMYPYDIRRKDFGRSVLPLGHMLVDYGKRRREWLADARQRWIVERCTRRPRAKGSLLGEVDFRADVAAPFQNPEKSNSHILLLSSP